MGDIQLGSKFCQGAFGYVKKTEGILVGTSLLSFGDIRGN